MQTQLPDLSFCIQGNQVCYLTIRFCENILQISSLLVVFSCKHFTICILTENFHPNMGFLKKHLWILQVEEISVLH